MASLSGKISSLWRKGAQNPLYCRMANGAFWSLGAALGNNFGNFLVGIILVRILGKHDYGQYGMLRSTINMFILFSSFSIGATATKYIAEFRDTDREKIGRIIGLSLISVGVLSLIFFLGCYIGADYLAVYSLNSPEMSKYIKIGAWMILFATMNGVCIGILSGFESFSLIAATNTIGAVVFVISSWLGAWCWELKGALIALSVYLGCMMIVSLFLLGKDLKKYQIVIAFKGCSKELPMLWKFSLPSTFSGMIITPVLWFANTILIKSPGGYEAMAVYDILTQWKFAVLFLPNIMGRVGLPILSNLNHSDNKKDHLKVIKINLLISVGFAFLIAAVLTAFSKIILRFYGDAFVDNTFAFIVVMLISIVLAANSVIAQIILSKGKAWQGLILNSLWAVEFIFLVHLGVTILQYSVLGILFALLISYIIHAIVQYWYIYYILKKEN